MRQPSVFGVDELQRYLDQWPDEAGVVEQFRLLLHTQPNAFHRTDLAGHFTGSAWLASVDGARVLLMHHRKLDRWLQPGGHADGEQDLAAVALREATEETGLRGLRVESAIFDLDRHHIPARGAEPGHWHYDARFVVRADNDECYMLNEESNALAWRDVSDVASDASLDESLRRMAHKWLARQRNGV